MDISSLRREYSEKKLNRNELHSDPLKQFGLWLTHALDAEVIEPNAMVLATADENKRPSCRTVLLKHFDETGFIFYTSYESRKAMQIETNPYGAAAFVWKEIERQVTVEGRIEKTTREQSDVYFHQRPRKSQLAAAASHQSQVLESREVLETEYKRLEKLYHDQEIPLPVKWGGYRLIPDRIEFWQGHRNRLHDRFCYLLKEGHWDIIRLAP
jgi:pyridoxamine 5'-phosphate oxidase